MTGNHTQANQGKDKFWLWFWAFIGIVIIVSGLAAVSLIDYVSSGKLAHDAGHFVKEFREATK